MSLAESGIGGQDRDAPFALVIGGGQAGLASGYHLKIACVPFRITEVDARIGDIWRRRYASLTLFTPRAFSTLSGLPLRGDPDGYATRDEFADYAAGFDLPVTCGATVERLARDSGSGSIRFSVRARSYARVM